MKKKCLIFFCFICSICFVSKAQNGSIDLSFGQNGINIPDTVLVGDTIWFACWVVNNGQDVLAENILLKAARFDPVLGFVNNRTIGGQGPNFMYPNDSIQFSTGFLFEVVTNQNYLIGDNIVVIWPRADVPNTIAQTNQYVYSNVHVQSNSVASLFEKNSKLNSFYPQPAQEMIYFHPFEQVNAIQIINILGKEVLSYKGLASSIAISHLPEGVYLLKIHTEIGEEKLQQLIIRR